MLARPVRLLVFLFLAASFLSACGIGICAEGCLDITQDSFQISPMPWARKTSDFTVGWSEVFGAKSYSLSLASDPECDTVLQEFTDIDSTSYDITGLADGLYYLCVFAHDGAAVLAAENNGFRLLITQGIALGQTSTATKVPNGGPTGQNVATSAWTDGTRLAVSDTGNNRVLIWNEFPSSATTVPDIVLGQPDLTTVTPNTGGVSEIGLDGPISVFFDGERFIVADYSNHRVLIWNSFPTQNRQPANVVVGQINMNANAQTTTQTGLRRPAGVFSDGEKLYVADDGNNRILIYNTIPQSDGAPASVVLGQAGSFVTNGWDGAGATRASIDDPSSVWVHSGKLIVSDSGNNRILIWNTIPTAQTDPDVVIGQPDFTSTTANNGGAAARTLDYPTGASVFGGKLYVGDRSNNRALVWNSLPMTDFQPADKVYGQPDFSTVTVSTGGVSVNSMDQCQTAAASDVFFIASELGGHRTLLIPLN